MKPTRAERRAEFVLPHLAARFSGPRDERVIWLAKHMPKGGYRLVVVDLAGSTVKGATADTTLGLYRQRGRGSARLSVTGRDIAERTPALKMEWEGSCWQYLGEAEEVEFGERKQAFAREGAMS